MTDPKKFVLRLPPELHARAKKVALKNNMSLNTLIRNLMEQGLSHEARSDSAKLDKIIELLQEWD